MNGPERTSYFIHSMGRQLFVCDTKPHGQPHTTLIILPPLLEEMNASRHALSQLTLQLAQQGWRSLQFDLLGTGDSEGELADASLAIWQQNIRDVVALVGLNCPVHWLVVRSGALLLAGLQEQCAPIIAWHPTWKGQHWVKPIRRAIALTQQAAPQSNTLSYAGYTLPKVLLDELAEINTSWASSLSQSFYVASLAPVQEQSELSHLLDTPPFWLHHELPERLDHLWIERTTDRLNHKNTG